MTVETGRSQNVSASIDVDRVASDVIVFDKENNRVDDVPWCARTLQESPFNRQAFLLFRVVIWKQDGAGCNRIHLNVRRIGFRETAIHSDQSGLRHAIGKITRPNNL